MTSDEVKHALTRDRAVTRWKGSEAERKLHGTVVPDGEVEQRQSRV